MAKFSPKVDASPPPWLRPYIGKKWKPWTLEQWYRALVKEGPIKEGENGPR